MEEIEYMKPQPTWEKACDRCGFSVARFRRQSEVTCDNCGAEYNAGGQRLRDNWRSNRSWSDDDVDDMEGYEQACLREERDY